MNDDDPTSVDPTSEDQMPQRTLEHVHLVASKPVWAIIGFCAAVIASGFTAWLQHVDASQDGLETKVDEYHKAATATDGRIMRVETKIESIEKNQADMAQGVRDISQKIDRLMERR
jgi:predicted thioesterase